MKLYQYLQVLSEDQIIKLRRVAVGILQPSVFSEEEIEFLEYKMQQPFVAEAKITADR